MAPDAPGRTVQGPDRPRPVLIDGLLSRVHFPVTHRDLVASAEREEAPTVVVRALVDLPDRDYSGPSDVLREMSNFM